MKELQTIQEKLKAPKGQYNAFGKYKYRSCEDIVEAVKPLLNENKCILTMSDELVLIGERYYIKATATLTNSEWATVTTTGYAREEESKKWMDWSQVTWASSSYARKYALNWLFAIDDWVDSDKTNNGSNDWAVQKETSNTDTSASDEKPRFNKENLDKFFSHNSFISFLIESDGLIPSFNTIYALFTYNNSSLKSGALATI